MASCKPTPSTFPPTDSHWLSPHRSGFLESLAAQGYAERTVKSFRRMVDRLCAEAEARGLGPDTLDADVMGELAGACPRTGTSHMERELAMATRRFTDRLVRAGAIAAAPPTQPPPGSPEQLCAELDHWLRDHLGMFGNRLRAHRKVLRRVIEFCCTATGTAEDLAAVTPEAVFAFLDGCAGRAGWRLPHVRTILRFLFWSGRIPRHLSDAVAGPAGGRPDGLPRHLEAGVVRKLLEAVRGDRAIDLRDHAMLLPMARLGLRAQGELAPSVRVRTPAVRTARIVRDRPQRASQSVPAGRSRPAPRPGADPCVAARPRHGAAGRGVLARGDRRCPPPPLRPVDDGVCKVRPRGAASAGPPVAGAGRGPMIPVAERVEQYLVQREAFGTGLSASAALPARPCSACWRSPDFGSARPWRSTTGTWTPTKPCCMSDMPRTTGTGRFRSPRAPPNAWRATGRCGIGPCAHPAPRRSSGESVGSESGRLRRNTTSPASARRSACGSGSRPAVAARVPACTTCAIIPESGLFRIRAARWRSSGFWAPGFQNNHRLFRNANTSSLGRNRVGRISPGVVLAIACSFSSRSAWR